MSRPNSSLRRCCACDYDRRCICTRAVPPFVDDYGARSHTICAFCTTGQHRYITDIRPVPSSDGQPRGVLRSLRRYAG